MYDVEGRENWKRLGLDKRRRNLENVFEVWGGVCLHAEGERWAGEGADVVRLA
jgi:hypothetical protein